MLYMIKKVLMVIKEIKNCTKPKDIYCKVEKEWEEYAAAR